MTPIADPTLIADLVRAGLDAELVGRVANAIVSAHVTRTVTADSSDERRERDKLRKRLSRAKSTPSAHATEANDAAARPEPSQDSHADKVDKRCDLSSFLPSLPSVEGIQKSKKEVVTRARGTRITEDWQPRDEDREFVRGLGLDPTALRDEFVDFWIAIPGSRGLKLDWFKTYKNRAREVAGRRKGASNGRDRSVVAAQDRLNAKLAEFSEPDLLSGVRGEAGASDVRLLPARRSG